MIDGLKPYPAMKDSGVPWLGEVPEHWAVRRLKSAFDRIVGGSTPSSAEATYWDGDIVWVTPADVNKSSRLRDSQRRITSDGLSACSAELVPSGSIIVTSRAPVGNVAIADVELCTNQGCKALVPAPGIVDPTFGFQVLTILKGELQSLATGTTFTEISTTRLGAIPIPLPPLPEQAAIVRFLDHADRRIRRYIRAKQKLIKLLEEQKQAIIHRAVTRGLDPNVRLKPSGVEWLGDVPEHWSVKRFKFLARVTSGQVDPRLPEYRGKILVAPNHIKSGSGRIAYRETAEEQGADSGKYEVRSGQIIYSKIRPNLRKAAIADMDCLCSADMYPITVRESDLRTAYMLQLLLSMPFTKYAVDCSLRVAMPKVNREALGECWLWYPPLDEQDAILQFIEQATAPADRAIEQAQREIGLLLEYRTRLTADVVTGKFDVREVAARLPDEVEEAEPLDEIETEVKADEAGADDTDEVPQEAEA